MSESSKQSRARFTRNRPVARRTYYEVTPVFRGAHRRIPGPITCRPTRVLSFEGHPAKSMSELSTSTAKLRQGTKISYR